MKNSLKKTLLKPTKSQRSKRLRKLYSKANYRKTANSWSSTNARRDRGVRYHQRP